MTSTDPITILADALREHRAPPYSWAVIRCDADGRFPRAWKGTLDARGMCLVVSADYDALFPDAHRALIAPVAKSAFATLAATLFPANAWMLRRMVSTNVNAAMDVGKEMIRKSDRMRELYPTTPRLSELVAKVRS
jgi:hypothetical protein